MSGAPHPPQGENTTQAIGALADRPWLGTYRLVVCDGPRAGESLTLDASTPTRALVGQSRACQLVLTDPGVSRRHAAFDLSGDGVLATDLDSTNGTRVNGVRVREAILQGGELIVVGQTTLRLEAVAPRAQAVLTASASFGRLIGASTAMRRLYPLCERLAQSDMPAVIEGETGTGKELLAESLHEVGPRRAKPFIVFDCAGVPRDAVLSVLFGDGGPEGGSLLEQADGGTILIDEVVDLPSEAQARLMRLLDHREVRTEGAERISVDVRVLAATRRDLDKEVQAGRFREDLFFRLAVGRVELPPVRDREEDVPLLATFFWKRSGGDPRGLPPDLLARYEGYRWPGNVREIENAVTRRIALGPFEALARTSVASTPQAQGQDVIEGVLSQDLPLAEARSRVVEDLERRYVMRVLEKNGGSISRAAASSGVARRYFQILRARYAPR